MEKREAWDKLQEILSDAKTGIVQCHLKVLPEIVDTLEDALFPPASPQSPESTSLMPVRALKRRRKKRLTNREG